MSSHRFSAVGAAAATGAAFGACLTAAEAAAMLLPGGEPVVRGWTVLAADSVAGCAAAVAALFALQRSFRGAAPPPRAHTRALAVLWWLVGVAVVGLAVRQDVGERPGLGLQLAVVAVAAATLGAVAWQVSGRTSRTAAGATVMWCALCWAPVLTTAVVVGALPPAPSSAAVLLVPAGAAAVAWVAAAVLMRPGRPALRAAAVVAALAGAGLVQARSLPTGARVRDLPQPDAAAHAGWLAGKPNVVLIVLDTVRANNVSAYGYARATTPRLDALAAEGVRYARASTVATWTVPSHASLFTGLYPSQHGAGFGPEATPSGLDERFQTLAETLAARGYATASVAANVVLGDAFNLSQGFRYNDARPARALRPGYRPLLYKLQGRLPAALRPGTLQDWVPPAWRSGAAITDEALRWLDRPRDPRQPYLLFLNYMDAHTPFVPRSDFRNRWPGRSPRLPWYGLPWDGELCAGPRHVTPEGREHLRALYDAALSYLDQEVGRLLDGLRRRPDYGNTWIIVTSDHGEMLGEHARLGHNCQLYEEVLRVPFIVRYPQGRGAGRVDEASVQTVDVAPMVLEAVGLPLADAARATRRRQDAISMALCPCARSPGHRHPEQMAALAAGGLKLVEHDGRAELFDLALDPGETQDVRASRPLDAERLRARLHQWLHALAPSPRLDTSDPARLELLRSLGYH